MKAKGILALLFAVALAAGGCGGSGSTQSSSLSVDIAMLQVEDERLIHGTVYNDLDGDGVMDAGELGIEGVFVNFFSQGFVGDTSTDSNGMYAFDVSPSNAYSVQVVQPVGYISTSPAEVVVPSGDDDATVNFGLWSETTTNPIDVDVKPGSDINPLNLRSKGVLPVAILGSEELDVLEVDPVTVLLNGVPPLRWSYEDVWGPGEMADGYEDLTLKFSNREIAASLGDVQRGDVVVLTLDGSLFDGTPISGEETVWIVQGPEY